MRIRTLLFAGIILLLFLSGCSVKGNKTRGIPTPSPTPTPILEIISSKIAEIKIEAVYPAHMIVNRSYVITVSLVPKTGSSSNLNNLKDLENAIMVVTKPTPVGTPGASVRQAFGPGFEPFAIATLNAGTLKVLSTPSSDEQTLRQPVVEWDWNVTPQYTGAQILSVEITIKWYFTQSAVLPFEPKFRIGNPQLSAQVTEPPAHPVTPPQFITPGQINLGSLITQGIVALISTGVFGSLILWIWNRRKKKNEAASSSISSSLPVKDVTDNKKTS